MTETTNGFVLAEEDLKMRGSVRFLEPDSQVFQSSKWLILSKIFQILEEARKVASYISSIEAWQEDPEWRMIAFHLEKKEHLD